MAAETQYQSSTTATPDAPPRSPSETTADDATLVACKQVNEGSISRQPRFNDIRKNEDMYNGVVKPALYGRSNIPFDTITMRGFVDTLMSNLDEQTILDFHPNREQDKLAGDKMKAAWSILKGPTKAAWDDHILDMKFLASLSGRGFLKFRMGNQPKFYHDLETCDHYDMITEPQGGAYLDAHLFKYQTNIFRTKQDLYEAASGGQYNKSQVQTLIGRYADASWFKQNTDLFNNKQARYTAFGIDINSNNYVGQPLYRLTEGVMNYKGKWYYIIFSYEAKLWLRFQPLEEVFSWAAEYPGRGPWVSYATHRHPFLFWTPAPADDIRSIGYALKKILNLTIDNLEKRNWHQRAYNPKVFTNPTELLWKQNGLVKAAVKPGDNIQNSIYEFTTPDTTNITINLTQFLDAFVGQKTGITAESQGDAKTDKVGIVVSNMKQVSNRMGYNNKMYRKMLTDLGTMFDYGLYQFLREPMAVKLIGPMGVRWEEEVTREDVEKEFTIAASTNLEEDEKNQTMLTRRVEVFGNISQNPILLAKVNTDWYLREQLKTAGYSDESARIALDPSLDGDEILYAQAAEAIQDILDGDEYVCLNRNATSGFIQKILNFAKEKYDLLPPSEMQKLKPGEKKRYEKQMQIFDRLVSYAKAHITIAKANNEAKAALIAATKALQQAMNPGDNQQTPEDPTAAAGGEALPAEAPAMSMGQ